jgi:hypothetical protein
MQKAKWSVGVMENLERLLFRASAAKAGLMPIELTTLKRAEARAPMNAENLITMVARLILRLSSQRESIILTD